MDIFTLNDPQAWLRDHKALAFGIPILGGAVSLYPSYLVGALVAPQFGIDPTAPIMPQPHAMLFVNIFVLIAAAFALCGFFAGAEIVVRILMHRFSLNWRDGWREFAAKGWGKAR